MRAYLGITDFDWYQSRAGQPQLDEVCFWQPGGNRTFGALNPGELFLFKLHAPRRAIVGGGLFAHSTLLPISLAWDAFEEANGVHSLSEMRRRVERYRRTVSDAYEDYIIGCILLEQPFFLRQEEWIQPPPDWHPNIVQGKTYDLAAEPGTTLWQAVRYAMMTRTPVGPSIAGEGEPLRFGQPVLVRPRLGQGSFRILVTDAYERNCAITRERVLPVLEAAHIRPYAEGGEHSVDNGLLLRSDLHTLFDRGYLTVTPELRVEVSRRVREEWNNGRHYYALHGQQIHVPEIPEQRPAVAALRWHNEQAFRA